MKVYKKNNGKIIVLSKMKSGKFGGIEAVFLNYSLKGTLQAIYNFNNEYTYLREPTPKEIDMYYNNLNGISFDIIKPTENEIKLVESTKF